ncbi:MAG: penicillin-binding protein 2 [Anaerolineaceae bacterium]|nr:MAG: penicillin-binding protein 2 [Anaerolineaceae bacterium]
MKHSRVLIFVATLILLAACGRSADGAATVPGGTGNLPTPVVGITRAPKADAILQTYLDAYAAEDFAAMYALITEAGQANTTQEAFTDMYMNSLDSMSVKTIEYSILSVQVNANDAQAAYRLVYHTTLFGGIARDFNVTLASEGGDWRVQWDRSLILPEMAGGNTLTTNYAVHARGSIYDRNGNPIVNETYAVALALVPAEIVNEQEGSLMEILWRLTGLRPDTIRAIYQSYPADQYVPIGETTAADYRVYHGALAPLLGWRGTEYTARYYYDGGIASQTVGYLGYLETDDIHDYRRRGYSRGALVGRAGIEKWGEDILHGRESATLLLLGTDGKVIYPALATAPEQPASNITLTIDADLQKQAEAAMDGMQGAIVVLERDTGRVLALVSSPGYNPNFFVPDNLNTGGRTIILNDTNQPLYNRATQGAYPLGSVFKVITTAAALESGQFTRESTYDCQYDFTELVPLGGNILHDWTWEHCQNEMLTDPEETLSTCTQPSGMLTLPEGLMRSCNPWFWHIGLGLYNAGMGDNISDMARGFGLGSETGIQIEESAGNIPNPGDGQQATNIAVGQGDVLVSPLQVADFMAAVGNGGTLYRPQLVEKITAADGTVTFSFQPEVRGTLPVSEANLAIIQDALHEVVTNRRGTAWLRLNSLPYAVSGKTGTAESGIPGYPHAWFAGYTSENRPDKPDIAIVVFVYQKGEGSDYAAPVFRRIVEIYFSGHPQTPYWFEESIGVTETPTPTNP